MRVCHGWRPPGRTPVAVELAADLTTIDASAAHRRAKGIVNLSVPWGKPRNRWKWWAFDIKQGKPRALLLMPMTDRQKSSSGRVCSANDKREGGPFSHRQGRPHQTFAAIQNLRATHATTPSRAVPFWIPPTATLTGTREPHAHVIENRETHIYIHTYTRFIIVFVACWRQRDSTEATDV